MSGSTQERYSIAPAEWLSLSAAPDALLTEFKVQKVFKLYPFQLRLSGILECHTGKVRGKATLKERLLGGTLEYHPGCHTLEYRKRFSFLGGLVGTNIWGAWDVTSVSSAISTGSWSALRPRVGCGLTLDEAQGLTRRLLRPLSFELKTCVPLGRSVRLKAYSETTIRLPRRLSLWAESDGAFGVDDFVDDDEPQSHPLSHTGSGSYGPRFGSGRRGSWRGPAAGEGDVGGVHGGGARLLVNLQKTALVVDL